MNTFHNFFEIRDGHLHHKLNGKRVGTIRPDGYVQVTCGGRSYLAHRVIFEMHYGYRPNVIDHINGDRADNRIENLRECTMSQNHFNKRPRSTSAAKNVSWNKRVKKWYARVRKDNKVYCGGYHDDLAAAIAEATEMRNRLHGEFARHA